MPEVIGLVIGLVIGSLIGAILLRAAVSMYNKISQAGHHDAVPEPEFGKAIGIALVTSIVNVIVSLVVNVLISAATETNGRRGSGGPGVLAQLASLPVSFFVMAGMLTIMLPAPFYKAMIVTLNYILITIAIVAVLFGVGILVMRFIG